MTTSRADIATELFVDLLCQHCAKATRHAHQTRPEGYVCKLCGRFRKQAAVQIPLQPAAPSLLVSTSEAGASVADAFTKEALARPPSDAPFTWKDALEAVTGLVLEKAQLRQQRDQLAEVNAEIAGASIALVAALHKLGRTPKNASTAEIILAAAEQLEQLAELRTRGTL